jgi:hypothetical protein
MQEMPHMKPSRPNAVQPTTRRNETVAGLRVTILCRGEIETVRGAPKCRWCGKSLRPKYITERKAEETKHHYDQRPKNVPTSFDRARQQWVVVSTAYRVARRTFEGCFGAYGDNRFCGLNCGRDYAVAIANAIANGELRLVDKMGKDVAIAKGHTRSSVTSTPSRRGGAQRKSEQC